MPRELPPEETFIVMYFCDKALCNTAPTGLLESFFYSCGNWIFRKNCESLHHVKISLHRIVCMFASIHSSAKTRHTHNFGLPVQWCLLRASEFALWLSRASAHFTLPRVTARWRGVLPRGSNASKSCCTKTENSMRCHVLCMQNKTSKFNTLLATHS